MKLDMNVKNETEVLVNLGCGQTRPNGWLNFDSSLNSLIQSTPVVSTISRHFLNSVVYDQPALYLDLRKKWPFKDGSVSVIYASHIFEHFTKHQAEHFLTESFRVLRSNGIIRLVVPDLEKLSFEYLEGIKIDKIESSSEFLYALNLHKENTYPSQRSFVTKFIGSYQGYPHQHKYMYDRLSLKKILLKSGFGEVLSNKYGKSEYIEKIGDVENTAEGVASIYLEASKNQ